MVVNVSLLSQLTFFSDRFYSVLDVLTLLVISFLLFGFQGTSGLEKTRTSDLTLIRRAL